MTIIQKIINYSKKISNFGSFLKLDYKYKVLNLNTILLIGSLIILSLTFFYISQLISKNNSIKSENFKEVTKSNEFLNLSNYFLSKIESPYEEISYSIKNNDSIERILKELNIRKEDINIITKKIK